MEAYRSAHLKAMEVAKEAWALLSYDPNLRLPLWPSPEEARKKMMSIRDKAEVIKVSDNELEFLTGSDKIDDETAMSPWHPNLMLLLVTLGDKGCNYYTKENDIMVKICCTGAGHVGGQIMAVIALKCPDIEVAVVDISVPRMTASNRDQLPIYEPALDEVVKQCRGKNLRYS